MPRLSSVKLCMPAGLSPVADGTAVGAFCLARLMRTLGEAASGSLDRFKKTIRTMAKAENALIGAT